MIAQDSLQDLIVSEPKHWRHPAPTPGPIHFFRRLREGLVVPILLVAVAVLISAHWSPPGSVSGNGSTTIQTPLPPPAPTAGKAAWTRYYHSYDLLRTSDAPVRAQTIAVVRAPVPQPRALPVDPTRSIPAPTPVATPRISAHQTR